MSNHLEFKLIKPQKSLIDFVESFWLLHNPTNSDKELIILPDGRIDMTLSQSNTEPFHITLSGLETQPDKAILKSQTTMYAVSFKLLATEYIFQNSISNLLNYATYLPKGFWDFSVKDLNDFDSFCKKAAKKIEAILPKDMDNRKRNLFNLIYASNGALSVKDLSEKVHWSSRQINRYFNQQFGLSLKAYCNILRFRASFHHIKEGKLFPEENFADQSHFIKEVKKLSGVSPKELKKNQNDRFIQLSMLPPK